MQNSVKADICGQKRTGCEGMSEQPQREQREFRAGLSVKQVTALTALLSGSTIRDAALKAGVDERTIRRWRADDPNFETSFRRALCEIRDEVTAFATVASQTALKTLVAIASDQSDPRSLRAALELLKMARIGAPIHPRLTLDEVRIDQLMTHA